MTTTRWCDENKNIFHVLSLSFYNLWYWFIDCASFDKWKLLWNDRLSSNRTITDTSTELLLYSEEVIAEFVSSHFVFIFLFINDVYFLSIEENYVKIGIIVGECHEILMCFIFNIFALSLSLFLYRWKHLKYECICV